MHLYFEATEAVVQKMQGRSEWTGEPGAAVSWRSQPDKLYDGLECSGWGEQGIEGIPGECSQQQGN